MKLFTQLAALFLIAATWVGCKSSSYTPDTFTKNQLIFGTGGGFAGTVDTYFLLENGQLFHQPSLESEVSAVSTLDKKTAKAFFAEAEEIDLPTRRLDVPGNMYAFLEWRTPEGSNRLVWDTFGEKAAPELKELHAKLMELAAPVR